jgi:hypothetical protein
MSTEKRWERRRALRWGSEHVGWHETVDDARNHANADIKANGSVGRIESTDWAKRILYYDVHEELT